MPELCHRDRVSLALSHQDTDRVPIAMVCAGINQPAYQDLSLYLGRERGLTVEAYLAPLIDIASVSPRYVGPALLAGTDIWGVARQPVSYGRGAYDEIRHYPLADVRDVSDLDKHRWPSPDWFDYTVIPDRIAARNGVEPYCIMESHGGNLFETAWYMRGFERSFEDMLLRPELFHAIMARVTDFYVEHCRRALESGQGEIDLVFTADDIGSQKGLLMSLGLWKSCLKPYHERLNTTIHAYGAKVIYHTDGSVMEAVPGLMDMGIDVLQALQFDAAGMDACLLKERHGAQLCFEGGVSVQRTLPFGSPDEVREEALARIAVLGEGGGYILGPSHAIQAGTPPENIVAMFDAAATAWLPGN